VSLFIITHSIFTSSEPFCIIYSQGFLHLESKKMKVWTDELAPAICLKGFRQMHFTVINILAESDKVWRFVVFNLFKAYLQQVYFIFHIKTLFYGCNFSRFTFGVDYEHASSV